MNTGEQAYLGMLEKILLSENYRQPVDDQGTPTEEGRYELFAHTLKFDLTDNKIPLMTTKKVFFKSLAAELLWFLSGSQKIDFLKDLGVKIWDIWGNEENVVGPLYGSLAVDWRTDPSILLPIDPKIKEFKPPVPPQDRMVADIQGSIDGATYQSNLGKPLIVIAEEDNKGNEKIVTVQFLNTGSIRKGVLKQQLKHNTLKDLYEPLVAGVGYVGEVTKPTKIDNKLKENWSSMLHRCYDIKDPGYLNYGGRGIFVDPEWHDFSNYQRDVQKISGWCRKLDMPELYELDKDYWASNCYSKDTCVYLNNHDSGLYRRGYGKAFSATHKDGRHIPKYLNHGRFADEFGLSRSAISRCLRGERPQHKGWIFEYLNDGKLYRPQLPINQFAKVVESLRDKPEARSHVVTMWRPDVLPLQAIKACHGTHIQFYRLGDEISLLMTQRSCDAYLGVSFNIAQYALLCHMVAHQLGCRAKEFTWVGADVHIYENHLDQVIEQIGNPVLPVPTISFNRPPETIFDYTLDDFEVVGYEHAPYVPAEVSPQGQPGKGVLLV